MAAKPRPIFEDVSDGTAKLAKRAVTGGIDGPSKAARIGIRRWLMVIFALTALIIFVGGMTRLTDSGLSITEWKPISGMLPPLSQAAWEADFELYKLSPEYLLQNKGMTLSEFEYIFWWEWGHRFLARIIGLVWAIGFVFFWATKRIPVGWTRRLFGIGALIGLQGAVGWWMVSSGLEAARTDVASYRLATHLGLAFVIFGFTAWFIFLLGRREADLMQARRVSEVKLFKMSTGLMHLAFVQILLGALVAGIDAGRAFPTWPLMGDGFLPPDPFGLTPLWRNFFEDAGLVQFVHRMAAYLLVAFGIVVWLRARKVANQHIRLAFHMVLGLLLAQVVLGIVTALYSAPLPIAIAHQFGAIILWVLILRARYLARYPVPQTIRGHQK